MWNKDEAKIAAIIAIAGLFGKDYVRNNIEEACESYPCEEDEDIEYEYFLGFEGDEETNKWTVFARILVNRKTKEVQFLDYKTPKGERMENPIRPVRFA